MQSGLNCTFEYRSYINFITCISDYNARCKSPVQFAQTREAGLFYVFICTAVQKFRIQLSINLTRPFFK